MTETSGRQTTFLEALTIGAVAGEIEGEGTKHFGIGGPLFHHMRHYVGWKKVVQYKQETRQDLSSHLEAWKE